MPPSTRINGQFYRLIDGIIIEWIGLEKENFRL